jgi:peptide chain release factor 1
MMHEKLIELKKRYREVWANLTNPEIVSQQELLIRYSKEESDLKGFSVLYDQYIQLERDLVDLQNFKKEEKDPKLAGEYQDEIFIIQKKLKDLDLEIQEKLLPKDPTDEKSVIVEIRGAAGGEEAALFSMDLFRMYTNYGSSKGWKITILSSNQTGLGGLKEIIFSVEGKNVYHFMRFESGVHRVQRVPSTESSGRVHTSTSTVAVLPEAEEAEIDIKPDDIRIDVFNASGHGGQNVQKNETAIRITHLPTGIAVSCQDERSQLQNKEQAFKVLRAKLLEAEQTRIQQEEAKNRKSQVGWGDRSEKIRTYNFPQSRVTDHRIGLTLYNLPEIINGSMDELIQALRVFYDEKRREEYDNR